MKRLLSLLLFLLAVNLPPAYAATLLPQGESCFQATTGITGMVGALGAVTPGAGGTNNTYGGVPLTGGSGTGATANITVTAGGVASVAILNPGTAYVVSDVLSAAPSNIGNVTGFSVPINSVSINSSLAGGTVGFYVPNTQTFSQTWQNSAQTILNNNPVNLDQNGCAIIYGEGVYRQILKDSLGNTVWDQLTASTDQSGFFWAGLAGGTPNAITLTDPNFSSIAGQAIQFRANATNTGPVTIQVSGGALIPVVKDTSTGPQALTGSEIAIGAGGQNNVVSVIFDSVNDEFHLVSFPPNSAVNEIVPYQGGFKNLVITNGAVPNIQIALTADQLVLENSAGGTFKANNVNCTINITTNTFAVNAGGMDLVTSESPVSQWISVWSIYNPTTNTQSCVGAIEATALAPVLPSGYTFSARFGWMTTDGSSLLMRTAQHGRKAVYIVTPSTNTASLPQIVTGNTSSVLTPVSVSPFVPPTADEITISLQVSGSNVGFVAPNANYGLTIGVAPVPLERVQTGASISMATVVPVELESTNIFWASAVPNSVLSAYAWEDNL
jgi:hypothetical protein